MTGRGDASGLGEAERQRSGADRNSPAAATPGLADSRHCCTGVDENISANDEMWDFFKRHPRK
jgi:poly(3-hydroxybutyrate) depolymerase